MCVRLCINLILQKRCSLIDENNIQYVSFLPKPGSIYLGVHAEYSTSGEEVIPADLALIVIYHRTNVTEAEGH